MPTRYRILLAKRAASDLEEISKHIAKDSVPNAAKMVGRILDAIELLKIFPHRNVLEGQHPKIKHPVRTLPVQSYIVFFRVDDAHQTVRVLRIRHGAMKRPKRFE
jgi:toxin ParE1/3/4